MRNLPLPEVMGSDFSTTRSALSPGSTGVWGGKMVNLRKILTANLSTDDHCML